MHVVMVFHYDPDIPAGDDHIIDLSLLTYNGDEGNNERWTIDDPEGQQMIAGFISCLNRTHPELVTHGLSFYN